MLSFTNRERRVIANTYKKDKWKTFVKTLDIIKWNITTQKTHENQSIVSNLTLLILLNGGGGDFVK